MGSSDSEIVEKLQALRSERAESEPTEPEQEEITEKQEPVEADEGEAVSVDGDEPEEEVAEASDYDEDYSETIDTVRYEYDADSDTYSFKSDGKRVRANADKLIENFSKAQNYTKDKMALAEERKAFETERDGYKSELEAEKAKLADLSLELEALVKFDDDVDLAELEEYDPSEYIRVTREREKRKKLLDEIKSKTSVKAEPDTAVIERETKALMSAKPEWADQEVMNKDLQALNSYLASKGFGEAELKGMTNHKMYLVALDAAKLAGYEAKEAAIKKQVKKSPKTVRSTVANQPRTDQELAKLKAKANSGRNEDVQAYLRAKREAKRK